MLGQVGVDLHRKSTQRDHTEVDESGNGASSYVLRALGASQNCHSFFG